LLLVNLLVRL
jgi:hypothetical protein